MEAGDQDLDRYLTGLGASSEQLREALASGTVGSLALDLVLRSGGEAIRFSTAAARVGLSLEKAAALWRALGFPDPRAPEAKLSPAELRTLALLARVTDSTFGFDGTTQLARVIGASAAQIAEAAADAFRVHVEMPSRDQGQPYHEVLQSTVQIASELLPELDVALAAAVRAHLVVVSRSTWALDPDRATITRERTVGFADLVDFTGRARILSPAALAHALSRFESQVGDVVARFEGRVVKLIGDEAMFVVSDPAKGCELARELGSTLAGDPQLPSVRIGVAAGPVVSRSGDYYGDTVNLAARLVKLAKPGEVLVSESLFASAGGSVSFEAIESLELKGYEHPVPAYRLLPI